MKKLKRGHKNRNREKQRNDIFMSMNLPANVVRGINRKSRYIGMGEIKAS